MSTNPLRTKKQNKRAERNRVIRNDYDMLIKIHGSSKMGVYEYLAKKHDVSLHTIIRCVQSTK